MKDLKGTKTEKNLQEAFAGESMARNKYTYFAKVAKKEGYEQIAGIFSETADNEQQHAKEHFKYLKGIGSTLDNLRSAAEGEHYEWSEMYPRMANEAHEEGFEEIALKFENIAKVEKAHEARYKKFIEALENGTVFKKDKTYIWKCRKCGYLHESSEPPVKCPACGHPSGYYEIQCINY